MANTHTTLIDLFTGIANAIRIKKGTADVIVADTFPAEIENLRTGFDYNNQNVISVPDYAFYGCEDLNSVDCYNLTSVGTSAFEGCSNLKSVILYDSVESVGENAFKGCSNVIIYYKGISIPDTWSSNWNPDNRPVLLGEPIETWDISATEEDNVTANIYNDIHNEGKYLLFINGRGNVADYENGKQPWYNYMRNISSVIMIGVTNISNRMFYDCTGLTSITIPDSVTSIGSSAFYNCTSLTIYCEAASKPSGWNSSWNSSNRPVVWGYTGSNGVTDDGFKWASVTNGIAICGYSGTNSEIVIPEKINSIGVVLISQNAFRGNTIIASVTIPDSVTSIDSSAFSGCDSLTSVYITDVAKWCGISFGGYDSNPLAYAHNLYLNGELVTELVIPDSVTSIGSYGFYGCDSLTSVTIGNSVTSIGPRAFLSCTSLTNVTIPDSITSIGDYAFNDCTSLTSITIGNGVTRINTGAFYNCTSLTSVTIPDSVTIIDVSAFYYCTGLTSITIPDSVTSIGSSAFEYCYKLVEVINHSSLNITAGSSSNGYVGYYAKEVHKGESKIVNVGDYLFYTYNGVNYLLSYIGTDTELVLPENYNGENYEIYNYTFYYCTSLTSVTIPDSVTSIGNSAFYNCTSLTSITIPDSVISIGDYAFYGCTSLVSVTIGDSVTSIGSNAFLKCTGLTSVYITDAAKWCGISFGGYDANPLYRAHNLYLNGELVTELVIPDSVTSIGSYGFFDCDSLVSVVIPDSVTSIGSGAFKNCGCLSNISFNGTSSQWNAITKNSGWKNGVPATYVQCSDGQVAL